MAYRFILNGKIIWDNKEFEDLLLSGSIEEPANYLPPKRLNNDIISIGGWHINIQSTIHPDATPDEVINGYKDLGKKLRLPITRLFLPFFALDIRNYRPNQTVQAIEEPFISFFLRLCYWYHRCSKQYDLAKKNKEIRDKLKVSNALVASIKKNGLNNLTNEWFRQAIGVVYELMCASLCDYYNKRISFEKKHDFLFETNPAEVKTIFPRVNNEYREFYPHLNNKLRNDNVDLMAVMRDFIKIPKIMDNNLKYAIDRQQGRIVFLNLIVEGFSFALTFLSEYKQTSLSFQDSLNDSIKLLDDNTRLPIIISFHAVHCKYEIFSLMLSVPITKENNQTRLDMSRL